MSVTEEGGPNVGGVGGKGEGGGGRGRGWGKGGGRGGRRRRNKKMDTEQGDSAASSGPAPQVSEKLYFTVEPEEENFCSL